MTVQPIQPQDHRPAKAAQRTAARKQKQMDSEAIGIRINGVDYVVNPNDITGSVERKIRQTIGKGFAELADDLAKHPGIDLVGEFMWAIRFANGEQGLDLDEVLDSIDYASEIEEIKSPVAGPKA